jgi:hypothetical protein
LKASCALIWVNLDIRGTSSPEPEFGPTHDLRGLVRALEMMMASALR